MLNFFVKKKGYIISEECTGCYVCLEKCPENAIITGEVFSINKEKCTECGECVEVCPLQVIIYIPEEQNPKINQNDKT